MQKIRFLIKMLSISEDNDLLKDFAKDTYEIVAKFKPSEKTKKLGSD